jgi:hypothetical protein
MPNDIIPDQAEQSAESPAENPVNTTTVSNGQLIVFERATSEDVVEARNYRAARGNPLKQMVLGLPEGEGFILPTTLFNRKGQQRTLQSIRLSVKKWGADVGKNHEGKGIVFKIR